MAGLFTAQEAEHHKARHSLVRWEKSLLDQIKQKCKGATFTSKSVNTIIDFFEIFRIQSEMKKKIRVLSNNLLDVKTKNKGLHPVYVS